MTKSETFHESHRASYCPESNKLHLYVGRVPRAEYDALREEGWHTTPKQSEAGGGEFAATWTPARRNTALSYAGVIEDEDMGPDERAADRAERFGLYRDKRTGEACDRADAYDAQPEAHGFQSEARAERSAARHDRIADRATDAWGKAEYWQRRTAGVIAHALYVSSPAVRMGRIKEIEAQIRKIEASHTKANAEHSIKHAVLLALVEHTDGKREKMLPFPGWQYSVSYIREADKLAEDAEFTPEQMRRCMVSAAFSGEYSVRWQELRKQAQAGEIEASELAREWLNVHGWEKPAPCDPTKGDWHQHLTLRLAYENQMLEAQGGRAAFVEMEVGGWLGSHQIRKVNKSNATGRVVSVGIMYPARGCDKWGNPYPAGVTAPTHRLEIIKVERMGKDVYRPPTDEERAAFVQTVKAEKKAAPKAQTIPLINPTDADAERLQSEWNSRAQVRHDAETRGWGKAYEPKSVQRITQATYSANSKGSYARAETRELSPNCELADRKSNMYSRHEEERRKRIGAPVCQIRVTGYNPCCVVVIADKPQKALPAGVWAKLEIEVLA